MKNIFLSLVLAFAGTSAFSQIALNQMIEAPGGAYIIFTDDGSDHPIPGIQEYRAWKDLHLIDTLRIQGDTAICISLLGDSIPANCVTLPVINGVCLDTFYITPGDSLVLVECDDDTTFFAGGSGAADADFYEVGTTDPPNAIADSIYKDLGYMLLEGLDGGLPAKIEFLGDGQIQWDKEGLYNTAAWLYSHKALQPGFGVPRFGLVAFAGDNTGGARKNNTYAWGINPAGIDVGTALYLSLEGHYQPTGVDSAHEIHLVMKDIFGNSRRIWTWFLPKDDPDGYTQSSYVQAFNIRDPNQLGSDGLYFQVTRLADHESSIRFLGSGGSTGGGSDGIEMYMTTNDDNFQIKPFGSMPGTSEMYVIDFNALNMKRARISTDWGTLHGSSGAPAYLFGGESLYGGVVRVSWDEAADSLNLHGVGGSDHDWYEVGTTTPPSSFNLDMITGTGKHGFGVTTPYSTISGYGDAGMYRGTATTALDTVGASLFLGDAQFYNGTFFNKAPGFTAIYNSGETVASDLAAYTYAGGDRLERIRIRGSGEVGIGTNRPAQTFHVQGTARITGSSGTATAPAGRNASGDVSTMSEGYGVNYTGGAIEVDTTATGVATPYDLTQIPISALKDGIQANTIDSDNFLQWWKWDALTDAPGLRLSTSSTGGTSHGQKVLEIVLDGNNSNSSEITTGAKISNTHGGTNPVNYGLHSYVEGGGASSGVIGETSTGRGVVGITDSGTALRGVAGSGSGLTLFMGSGLPIDVTDVAGSTNTVETMAYLAHGSSGTVANGFGQSLDFNNEAADGGGYLSHQLISKWADATAKTSSLLFKGLNANSSLDLFTFDGPGQLQLNQYTTSNFNGGTSADSVLVVSATGIVKKRNAAAFGGVGASGVDVEENDASEGTGILTLDFLDPLDVVVVGSEADVSVDLNEITTDAVPEGDEFVAGSDGSATNEKWAITNFDLSTTNEIQTLDVSGTSQPITLDLSGDASDPTLTGSGSATVSASGNAITVAVPDEAIQDVIGGMVTGNTETGISVTYDDAGNQFDFVVSGGGFIAQEDDVDSENPATTLDLGDGFAWNPSTGGEVDLQHAWGDFATDGALEGDELVGVWDPSAGTVELVDPADLGGGADGNGMWTSSNDNTNIANSDFQVGVPGALEFRDGSDHDFYIDAANDMVSLGVTTASANFHISYPSASSRLEASTGAASYVVKGSADGGGVNTTQGTIFMSFADADYLSGAEQTAGSITLSKLEDLTQRSSLILNMPEANDANILAGEKNADFTDNTTESHVAINGGIAFTQNYEWTATSADLALDRSYNIVNVSGSGAIGDEITLPEVQDNGDNFVTTLTSIQCQVGQTYTITNFRASVNLVIRTFTGDVFRGAGTTVSVAPGFTVKLQCIRLNGGVGYWSYWLSN